MTRKDFTELESNLRAFGYQVHSFETAKEAAAYLNESIDQQTVGFGGSMTLGEMGLFESLGAHNQVYWHLQVPQGKTREQVLQEASMAKLYITSANAISQQGEIVNIDGTCNRVASIFYGHEKVIFIIGENKIEKDYDAALYRARNVAAPLNAKRLGKHTPCAEKADRCYDCKSPERICRGLSVLWQKPTGCEYEVILIHEDLGY